MENQFWAVGCCLGWTVGKRGLGRFCVTFFGGFFNFSWGKKKIKLCSVRTEKLHNTYFTKKKFFLIFWTQKSEKTGFFRANTQISNLNVLHKGLLLQDWVFRLGILVNKTEIVNVGWYSELHFFPPITGQQTSKNILVMCLVEKSIKC